MAGIGLAILTMGILGESGLDIFLLIITVLVIAYSFVPTVLNS
ncbi:hypothetical protein Hmuk_0412 [Halomicrobium mukohataei DSM 12286]|uniref:Uncharacterized protein n=1 Tax=Halomicrobium mukohataei (strain ATCC 700874 / DSM 12286 / JCM 9738 / NCIMB 13541) TaxID=485914 RepID=C7NXV8_HALMD|nr:hypothetical protein Hmuk_0412 [Halomicrobium mukohataei DSM 12286]